MLRIRQCSRAARNARAHTVATNVGMLRCTASTLDTQHMTPDTRHWTLDSLYLESSTYVEHVLDMVRFSCPENLICQVETYFLSPL